MWSHLVRIKKGKAPLTHSNFGMKGYFLCNRRLPSERDLADQLQRMTVSYETDGSEGHVRHTLSAVSLVVFTDVVVGMNLAGSRALICKPFHTCSTVSLTEFPSGLTLRLAAKFDMVGTVGSFWRRDSSAYPCSFISVLVFRHRIGGPLIMGP